MIKLNDYLYDGHTVIKILHIYHDDLYKDALKTKNEIDFAHCEFLKHQINILEHNDFLTSQSQRIRELYKYMAMKYPFLAFTFKGRIKSLIRSEEKFNGYIAEYIYNEYNKTGKIPDFTYLKNILSGFRDLIAYRIVISLPKCHVGKNEKKEDLELNYLYEIANIIPEFLKDKSFKAIPTNKSISKDPRLEDINNQYFRDYINNPNKIGYKSLHITLFDELADCYIELQLRTQEMDDYAEIGDANHFGYENRQKNDRTRSDKLAPGICMEFDEAIERVKALGDIDLSKVDVNMFGAINNSLINDGCGLVRGRLILPFEHLSGFQNDIID